MNSLSEIPGRFACPPRSFDFVHTTIFRCGRKLAKPGSRRTDLRPRELATPMSAYDKKIRLYGLADSRRFSLEGDVITRLVLEALQVTPSDRRRVNISPSNAWLDYTALDELWERSAPPSLPSRADALKAAESLLTRLEHKCSGANRAW